MIQHTKALVDNPPASGGELLLLHILAYRADASGRCFPGVERLAKETSMTERGVRKALKSLRDSGIVTTSNGGGRNNTNVYALHLETLNIVQPLDTNVDAETLNTVPETLNTVPETLNTVPLNPEHSSPETPLNIRETPEETPTRKRSVSVSKFNLPDWVPKEAWMSYEKSRKRMTDEARRLNLKDLEKLRDEGQDPEAVIEQSVKRGWSGLFPLSQAGGSKGFMTREDRNLAAAKKFLESESAGQYEGSSKAMLAKFEEAQKFIDPTTAYDPVPRYAPRSKPQPTFVNSLEVQRKIEAKDRERHGE